MALLSRLIASGRGWRVLDVLCDAGPGDRPFEERHGDTCIAIVTAGTFDYRTRDGADLLVPGAVMLGNHGACFECGHTHGRGDRCLSFRLSPEFIEEIAGGVRGVRSVEFTRPRLPPVAALTPLLGAAEVARDKADAGLLAELTVKLAAAALELQSGVGPTSSPTDRDTRRVSDVVRWVESRLQDELALDDLAQMACMSRYHFLRTFRSVAGVTPHQYILRRRLQQACVGLRRSGGSITAVAADAGFSDLSTFNRQFKRGVGVTPSAYRWLNLGRRSDPNAGPPAISQA